MIAFIGLLVSREEERHGPFLVVAPASTTENWMREFQMWCPELEVRHYYGSQAERMALREYVVF